MRQRLSILIALAVFTTLAQFSDNAIAQQGRPVEASSSFPSDAELDALLAARNWNGLEAAFSRPLVKEQITNDLISRRLNWLKARIDAGGGFFLAMFYARDLWGIGNALKVDDPNKDLRSTAALISLYAYEVIVIDGFKCEDRSAPSNRATQLFMKRATDFEFLRRQQPDIRSKIVDGAIVLEQRTAPLRTNDDLLCGGGLDEMRAGLERGKQQEVPTPEGHIGKTIAVTPPPDWAPKFVSPNVYRTMQDKARAEMRERLLRLAGKPS